MAETRHVEEQSHPGIEGYVNCRVCGAVLGYRARVGKALFLHVYAYPPSGVRCQMERRRVAARLLSGDVRCPHCGEWQEWNAAAERPWERR